MAKNLIILGGMDLGPIPVPKWVASADQIIAADSGSNHLPPSRPPDRLVGDGDSVPERWRHLYKPDLDQETTDCEKALAAAREMGWSTATVVGVEGDRLDHVLATLSACAASPLRLRLVLRLGFGFVVHEQTEVTAKSEPGALVSFLPLTECVATLLGVEWLVERGRFVSGGFKSISNRAIADEVNLSVESGRGVLFVHRNAHHPEWGEE